MEVQLLIACTRIPPQDQAGWAPSPQRQKRVGLPLGLGVDLRTNEGIAWHQYHPLKDYILQAVKGEKCQRRQNYEPLHITIFKCRRPVKRFSVLFLRSENWIYSELFEPTCWTLISLNFRPGAARNHSTCKRSASGSNKASSLQNTKYWRE